MKSFTLTALTMAAGAFVAVPAGYLAALSIAAAVNRRITPPRAEPSLRLAVLVPAHDEEVLVGRCIDTLIAQDYPRELFRVLVVADNCTDGTARVAREHGAEALERIDPDNRGKGHALRWAMDQLLASDPQVGAFVVVDADSITDPGLLRALASSAESGAQVVQADYSALVDGTDDRAQLKAAAFLLFHRVRFTGKAGLGLPCSLVGNGMLFTSSLVQDHPWSAFSEVEDLEYSVQLRLAGVGPAFAPEARLEAPVSPTGDAAEVQRRRWEGGRLRIARKYLPALIRVMASQRRLDLWDAAADLAVPPLGVLGSGIVLGTGSALLLTAGGLVPSVALLPWGFATIALPVHVVGGLLAADAPPSMVAALRSAPDLVLAELLIRARLLGGADEGERWVRTPRLPSVPQPARD
ncbi:MAG: glycosyltransferase family 2 protein [Propionicimonas sp.]